MTTPSVVPDKVPRVKSAPVEVERLGTGAWPHHNCSECKDIPTNHRCTYPVQVGGVYEMEVGMKGPTFCGRYFCVLCELKRDCPEDKNWCEGHQRFECCTASV